MGVNLGKAVVSLVNGRTLGCAGRTGVLRVPYTVPHNPLDTSRLHPGIVYQVEIGGGSARYIAQRTASRPLRGKRRPTKQRGLGNRAVAPLNLRGAWNFA